MFSVHIFTETLALIVGRAHMKQYSVQCYRKPRVRHLFFVIAKIYILLLHSDFFFHSLSLQTPFTNALKTEKTLSNAGKIQTVTA